MRLDEAIAEYTAGRTSVGYAKNTLKVERRALDLLLETVGNIHLRNLSGQHGEQYVASLLSKNMTPAVLNLYQGVIRRFSEWAVKRRYMTSASALAGRRFIVANAPRRRIPARDFARLLDACVHPQQRVIVALGLYLFLRSSEISHLDVQHVNLDAGEILVYQPKTKRYDEMPICGELDTELRRWLTWYAEDQAPVNGALLPHWPLVPARSRMTMVNDGSGKGGGRPDVPDHGQVNPYSRAAQVHSKVQDALRRFGWEVGPADREGVHTLRRSGARALFDEMVDTGDIRDGVLRIVQAMLHHKSVTMTEHYLGLEADRERRNDQFKGRRMFRPVAENVVELRREG